MDYRCSQCHQRLASDGEPKRCSNCGAEIGFEVVGDVPLPMRLFAVLLGVAIVVVVAGGVVSRLAA